MQSDLDQAYVFIFVRQDLFNWQQLVHVSHISLELGMDLVGLAPLRDLTVGGRWRPFGHPNVIVVGVNDEAALNAVCDELRSKSLPFRAWQDPDDRPPKLMSVATEPLSKRDRNLLHHYRPWSERNNKHEKGEG